MGRNTFLLLIIFSAFASVFAQSREKRRTGDQPPTGQCNYFNWGGTSGVHFYICCNNCDSVDQTCDGTTYHTASSGAYCDKCGVDNSKGNGKHRETFSCGGCSGQGQMFRACKHLYNSIPGTCWMFTRCFRKKCQKQYRKKRKRSALDVPDTCFNKICDAGENINNCPEDCCQIVNNQCKWTGDSSYCIPECCGDSTCCGSSGGSNLWQTWKKQTTVFLLCIFLIQICNNALYRIV